MLRQKYQKGSKYLKYLIPLFALVAFGIGVLLWCLSSTGYYSLVAVIFGKYDYPFVTTQLENQPYALVVDIGSRFPLALRRATLDGIVDKQPQGTVTICSIDGQKHEVPSYFIPKLKVEDMTLKNVIALESLEEDYDALGQFFGGEFNLLVDFPHSRIIACDTFSKLQAKKLVGGDWAKIPFEMHRSGVIFHVDTDFGTRRLVINTTSTLNLLNSSFMPEGQPFVSSFLFLGGRQFGSVTFESVDLPADLHEIDGFIGMEFLKEHAVYLDYTHKVAYVEPSKKYFERIPVILDARIDPILAVSIQGNEYALRLDLGSSCPFSLQEKILQNISKTKRGNITWHDFRGRLYQSPIYSIPEIKIGNLTFIRALAKRDDEDFNVNVTLKGSPLQLPGVIGLPILEKYNLFLDFPHSSIYACNDHLTLQKKGLFSEHFLSVPFILHTDGILVSVEMDSGIYRLVLDTGSTCTAMRAPHPDFTGKFCMMGHDFGERFIKTIDVSARCEFDGLLGMDFLREYPLFIDYSNKMIFIDLQRERHVEDLACNLRVKGANHKSEK